VPRQKWRGRAQIVLDCDPVFFGFSPNVSPFCPNGGVKLN
jgi:hypothetical protein